MGDIYGSPVDPAIVDCGTNKNGCKCQQAVGKDVEKIAATKFKTFLKCKKIALANLAGATAADLEDCVDDFLNPNSIAANSKGKIGKSVAKLGSDITKKCTNNVFPGNCSGATLGTLADCLDERVECRVCLAINAIDGLSVDCDLFDDGAANGSCPPPVVAACPLSPGSYTITQVSGGTLKVSTFAPFAFPTGGTIVRGRRRRRCQLRAPDRRPVPGRLQRADLLRACARLLGPHRPDRLWRRRDRLGRRLRLHRYRAR